jgi:hypothetical protein
LYIFDICIHACPATHIPAVDVFCYGLITPSYSGAKPYRGQGSFLQEIAIPAGQDSVPYSLRPCGDHVFSCSRPGVFVRENLLLRTKKPGKTRLSRSSY